MIENTVAIVAVGHSWTRAIQDHHEQLLPGCSWHHCNTPHTVSVLIGLSFLKIGHALIVPWLPDSR